MKKLFLLLILLSCSEDNYETPIQTNYSLEEVVTLENIVNETSGLIFIGEELITHNDSGGENKLYKIDSLNGTTYENKIIPNSSNIDWEDLAKDYDYLYIADFGNNLGNRVDLNIIKINITDFVSSNNFEIENISFSYSDQTNFNNSIYNHNYDAEALIATEDYLYVFTKNWEDLQTNIYQIPKTSGNHLAIKIGSLNTQGLITGADYIFSEDKVVLLGYNLNSNFIIEINNFGNGNITNSQFEKYEFNIPVNSSSQTEGISIKDDKIFLSAETNNGEPATLYRLNQD